MSWFLNLSGWLNIAALAVWVWMYFRMRGERDELLRKYIQCMKDHFELQEELRAYKRKAE